MNLTSSLRPMLAVSYRCRFYGFKASCVSYCFIDWQPFRASRDYL